MYLIGDIGGTKTNIVVIDSLEIKSKPILEKSFPSKEYESLSSILKKAVTENLLKVQGACFGVAGPVKNGRCEATNLPWIIDIHKIAEILGISTKTIFLINDLEAAAYGTECLSTKDLYILNEGEEQPHSTRCLISAGTGLGESIMIWSKNQYKPIPSEGGHTDFAPRNKIEIELLNTLMVKYGRVSYERILCGPGLLNVYEFFKERLNQNIPAWLIERLKTEDPSAVISEIGISKQDECCEKTIDLFVSVYGAEAGNLALKSLATGGVFIGGGIAPKIIDKIKQGAFMQSFTNKGRLSVMVSQIPVKVILNDRHPLLGCINYLRIQLLGSLLKA